MTYTLSLLEGLEKESRQRAPLLKPSYVYQLVGVEVRGTAARDGFTVSDDPQDTMSISIYQEK